MRAKIVVDLFFGDCGKGITTDYLSIEKPDNSLVIRFSGGSNAGHNVVIDDKSHIHSNYGSGTLRGLPSYFTEHTCLYLNNLINEKNVLLDKGTIPTLYVNPLTMLITPYDVAYNRLREKKLGHGSCGTGIGATMTRNLNGYKLYAIDLLKYEVFIEKVRAIEVYYYEKALSEGYDEGDFFDLYINNHQTFKELSKNYQDLFLIQPYSIFRNYSNLIFEGSQGILLDQNHGIFPHVTYANTTSKNAIELCDKLNILDREIFYVTRCYQTRHGNGWMSNQDKIDLVNNNKEINVFNEWQKEFKTGEIDYDLLHYSLEIDKIYSGNAERNLVVTCLDQRPDFKFDYNKLRHFNQIYESYSPESKNFKKIK